MTFFKNHKKQSPDEQGEAPQNGGRNLCILGIGALIVAIITTSISLKIYHDTGDVYLDRSRPGFISDEEKHQTGENIKETFSEDGEIDAKVLDEYLQKLEQMRKKQHSKGPLQKKYISSFHENLAIWCKVTNKFA